MNFFEKLKNQKELPREHWFEIAQRLSAESGRVPDPIAIRAVAIIDALGLPSGETSAIETDQEGQRLDLERDRLIAEYLTNKAGVVVDREKGIVSTDFRDIYPDGLPQELKDVLPHDTLSIMEVEYAHTEYTLENFGDTENADEIDCPVHYARLPGGIDLFMRGYTHTDLWQENHGRFLQQVNKHAKVVCIELPGSVPYGRGLEWLWEGKTGKDYRILMREAVTGGFNGLFCEVDARDTSKIQMDFKPLFVFFSTVFPLLPNSFFENYFSFLEEQAPSLANILKSPDGLKQALILQSTTAQGADRNVALEKALTFKGDKAYFTFPYLDKEGDISLQPTFLELGQFLFTDALAAVKLHLLAKLMAEGRIPKGPIVDYEGAAHLSSKQFFLRYLSYAMEVVLRTVNELMAGRVKEVGNLAEIYRVFQNPDWEEIIKEIVRLPLRKVENDPSKTVEPGPNQRRLIDDSPDILEIFKIDPAKVMPSNEEIERIREKLGTQP